MDPQNFKGRRRTTRSKTIVIDFKDEPTNASFTNINTNPPVANSKGCMEARTYQFSDLINAFQTIEKRSSEDPYVVNSILKKFKTNEEQSIETGYNEEKTKIEMEIFPKIMNNPFLRNDFEVPLDRIDKEQRKNTRRNSKSFH